MRKGNRFFTRTAKCRQWTPPPRPTPHDRHKTLLSQNDHAFATLNSFNSMIIRKEEYCALTTQRVSSWVHVRTILFEKHYFPPSYSMIILQLNVQKWKANKRKITSHYNICQIVKRVLPAASQRDVWWPNELYFYGRLGLRTLLQVALAARLRKWQGKYFVTVTDYVQNLFGKAVDNTCTLNLLCYKSQTKILLPTGVEVQVFHSM